MAKYKEVSYKNVDRFRDLGLRISYLRKLAGLNQEDLAEKADMSRAELSDIENPNIIRSFSLEILINIADALGVKASTLLDFDLPMKDIK